MAEFIDVDRYRSPGPKRVRFFCGHGEERQKLRLDGSLVVSRVRFDFLYDQCYFETSTMLIPLGAWQVVQAALLEEPVQPRMGTVDGLRAVRFREGEFAILAGDPLWAITADVSASAGGVDLTCWLEGTVVPAVEVR